MKQREPLSIFGLVLWIVFAVFVVAVFGSVLLIRKAFGEPVVALRPAPSLVLVEVDRIVVNRHRQVRTWQQPNWRHQLVLKREFTDNWWVSFWDVVLVQAGPVFFVQLVDRGWWRANQVEAFSPTDKGWAVFAKSVDGKPGLVIEARELVIVDSPYDWEAKNRQVYNPIIRP